MKKITYYVIGIHCFLVLWSALWMPSKKIDKKPLQVRMVVQAPATPIPVTPRPPQPVIKNAVQNIVATPSSIAPKATPVPKMSPVAKKSASPAPKNPVVKKAATASAPARPVAKKTEPAKSAPVVPADLVQQLQESIAKIDQKSHKDSPKEILPAPKWITQLKIDEESTGEESLFVATLISCLQNTLNLPENGAVKVELVLQRDGSFVQMKVLHSESDRNRKFLEQELKTVTFPPFSGNLKNEKEHTFVITFCNS